MTEPKDDFRLRVLFAGGGSGGHLYPAIAVADELARQTGAECEFIGSSRPVEAEILSRTPYRHHVIQTVTGADLKRQPLHSGRMLFRGMRQAGKVLAGFRPDVVVGCGGFASVPPVMAAKLRLLPVLLLEQNHTPGMATRTLAPVSHSICAPMQGFQGSLICDWRFIATGNPVRREIAQLADIPAASVLGNRLIVVIGGSQGSTRLNDAVTAALKTISLPTGWRILHLTGQSDHGRIAEAYRGLPPDADVRPYHPDIVQAYREAGLVVCRGGATTLSELACAGIPAIVIPILDSVHDHQRVNAAACANAGAARMLDESHPELVHQLAESLNELTSSDAERERMIQAQRSLARPQAAEDVAGEILKLVPAARRRR